MNPPNSRSEEGYIGSESIENRVGFPRKGVEECASHGMELKLSPT